MITEVEVIEEYGSLPIGSVCRVIKENSKTLRVQWGSMAGTYEVLVPKNKVKILIKKDKLIPNKVLELLLRR